MSASKSAPRSSSGALHVAALKYSGGDAAALHEGSKRVVCVWYCVLFHMHPPGC